MKSVGHLINGAVRHSGDRHLDITNPSTGKIDGKVSLASAEVTTEAIAAAQAVFPEWRATPPARRAQIRVHARVRPLVAAGPARGAAPCSL